MSDADIHNSDRIKELAVLVHDRMGLHFTDDKKRELTHGVARIAKVLGYSSTDSFVDFLLVNEWNQEILDSLASELTIGETYFLRDRKMFDMIENCVIPEKSNDRKLKFWCAACSTGEEPYSIALVLDRTIPDISSWDIEIFASDINSHALQKAENGVYSSWSFRESELPDKERYFRKNDSGSFEIHEKIKKMVNFFRLNLISEEYPSILNGTTDCDIIFCRNVLIYFSHATAENVVRRLYNCLKPGGLLILSATELAFVPEKLFELIDLCGNLVLKKPLGLNSASHLLKFDYTPNLNREISTNVSDAENTDKEKERNRRNRKVKRQKLLRDMEFAVKPEISDSAGKKQTLFSTNEKYEEAELLADRGKYKEALEICRQAIEQEPLQARWNYLYSVVLFESDKIIESAKAISRVLYLDPDNVMGHIMSGHINNALGRKKTARNNFNTALKILQKLNSDDVVYGSGGVTAKRLKATIEAVYGGI